MDDVYYCYCGLTPSDDSDGNAIQSPDVKRAHESRVIDHTVDGLEGLISIIGIKYTTARLVAEKCVDMVRDKLNLPDRKSLTGTTPIGSDYYVLTDSDSQKEQNFREYIMYQLENTMVIHLHDLVLRRMDLLARNKFSITQLRTCIDVMSETYQWNNSQILDELDRLAKSCFAPDFMPLIEEYVG